MRKFFWWSCAVVITVVIGFYLGNRWMCPHSNNFTSRCVQYTWRAATDWNPVVQAGRFLAGRSGTMVQQGVEQGVQPPHPHTSPLAPPQGGRESVFVGPKLKIEEPRPFPVAQTEVQPPPQVVEVIDLSKAAGEEQVHGSQRPGYIPPSPDFPLERELALMQQQQQQLGVPPPPVTVPPGDIEESEPVRPMPPADDDETCKVRCAIYEYWLSFFAEDAGAWKDAEELPLPQECDDEEEDADVEPMPPDDCQARQRLRIPDDLELFIAGILETTEPEAELLPMPTEEDGTVEEAEPGHEGIPDCREDPHGYQRCPEVPAGCPGSRCPAPSRQYVPVQPPEEPEPAEDHWGKWDDTAEYRRIDFHPGDFDLRPRE